MAPVLSGGLQWLRFVGLLFCFWLVVLATLIKVGDMSREIKFRVWDKSRSKMYAGNPRYVEFKINLYGELSASNYNPKQELQTLPIMQYTGLKDKNGVEIYDGDIVEYLSDFTEEKSNHQVKYFCDDGYPAFDFSPSISDDMNGFSAIIYQEIGTVEVIGNIYQNPELLKLAAT